MTEYTSLFQISRRLPQAVVQLPVPRNAAFSQRSCSNTSRALSRASLEDLVIVRVGMCVSTTIRNFHFSAQDVSKDVIDTISQVSEAEYVDNESQIAHRYGPGLFPASCQVTPLGIIGSSQIVSPLSALPRQSFSNLNCPEPGAFVPNFFG
jgi:hypothetical protein